MRQQHMVKRQLRRAAAVGFYDHRAGRGFELEDGAPLRAMVKSGKIDRVVPLAIAEVLTGASFKQGRRRFGLALHRGADRADIV